MEIVFKVETSGELFGEINDESGQTIFMCSAGKKLFFGIGIKKRSLLDMKKKMV